MVIGDPGRAGHPAASHVAQEQDLDLEAVTIPNLLVMEKVAPDQAQTHKTVTQKVAQVETSIKRIVMKVLQKNLCLQIP